MYSLFKKKLINVYIDVFYTFIWSMIFYCILLFIYTFKYLNAVCLMLLYIGLQISFFFFCHTASLCVYCSLRHRINECTLICAQLLFHFIYTSKETVSYPIIYSASSKWTAVIYCVVQKFPSASRVLLLSCVDQTGSIYLTTVLGLYPGTTGTL